MNKNKYIQIYESVFPNDTIDANEPRKAAIIAEMKAIMAAKTAKEAWALIDWWYWEKPLDLKQALMKIRTKGKHN